MTDTKDNVDIISLEGCVKVVYNPREVVINCSKYDSNHLNEHCALGMLKQVIAEGWHDVEFDIRSKPQTC